jgi:hypothetical protein
VFPTVWSSFRENLALHLRAQYYSTSLEILKELHWRAAMTHARIYQHGVKAFLDAKTLSDNPYDPAVNLDEYEAWEHGWLDAKHSSGRLQALEMNLRALARSSRPTFVGSL